MTTEPGVDLEGAVALAIQEADDSFGYNMSLTRLLDGVSTYTLRIDGEETTEHEGTDECYARIAEVKNRRRAQALLTALNTRSQVSGVGGEGNRASRDHAPTIGSALEPLIRVVCEDLETVAEELGEYFEMEDGPCEREGVCHAWICKGAGCIKDKADRARQLARLSSAEQVERESSRDEQPTPTQEVASPQDGSGGHAELTNPEPDKALVEALKAACSISTESHLRGARLVLGFDKAKDADIAVDAIIKAARS